MNFPNELLLQIFSNFDRKEDQVTIQALRRTNIRLRNLTKPLVYYTIADQIFCPSRDEEELKKISPLRRQTRILAQQPELSSSVKSIDLSRWNHIGSVHRLTGHGGPALDCYSTALQQVDIPAVLRHKLLMGIQNETPQGNLAFLIALCSEIEFLKIKSGFCGFGQQVEEVFRHATTLHYQCTQETSLHRHMPRPVILGSLKEISVGGDKYTSISEVLLLLSLPCVEILRASDVSDDARYPDLAIPPEDEIYRNNNPVKLIFETCLLSAPGIGRVLRACSRPRSLTVSWRPGGMNDGLSNRDIGETVRQFGTKLHYLHLDTTAVYEHRFNQKPPPFGSFAELTNTRVFAVPPYAFTGDCKDVASTLPPSVEKLYVLGVDDNQMRDGHGPWDRLIGLEGLPELKEVKHVNWFHFSLEEWFGTAHHRTVDYDAFKELGLVTRY
jgi:hypothetical protein